MSIKRVGELDLDLTIIIMFTVVALVVLAIIYIFKSIIIGFPNTAIKLEIAGYVLLAVSLGWSFLNEDLKNMSHNSDLLILNQKIDKLWYYNEDLHEYIAEKDINKIRERYHQMSKHIHDLELNTQGLKKQVETSRRITGALFVLSSLLIACGRGKELIFKAKSKVDTK